MKTVWPEAAMKNMEAAEQTWREQPAMTLKEFMAQSSGSTINEILRPHMTEDLKKRGATHTISARLETYDEWMSESKHATQNEAPYGQSTMKLSEDEYSAIGQMASKTGGIFGEALLLFRDWAAKQKQLPQGRTARLKMFKEWVEKHDQQYNEDQLITLHFLFRMGKV